jgi:hypothetical protein
LMLARLQPIYHATLWQRPLSVGTTICCLVCRVLFKTCGMPFLFTVIQSPPFLPFSTFTSNELVYQ